MSLENPGMLAWYKITIPAGPRCDDEQKTCKIIGWRSKPLQISSDYNALGPIVAIFVTKFQFGAYWRKGGQNAKSVVGGLKHCVYATIWCPTRNVKSKIPKSKSSQIPNPKIPKSKLQKSKSQIPKFQTLIPTNMYVCQPPQKGKLH